MAINFAHVVPKEAVEKHGADFGKNPVGTGAYKLTEWTLGQRLVFERNADYWNKGLPNLDKITFEIGQEPIVALLRLQKGEVDVLGDGIPPAQVPGGEGRSRSRRPDRRGRPAAHRLRHDERQRCRRSTTCKVRQAVNMAINKDRIVQHHQQPRGAGQPAAAAVDAGLHQGLSRATPTTRRRPRRCSPRPAIADGFATELYAMNTDPNPRIAQAIQQDLAAIGIKAEHQVAGPGQRHRRRRRRHGAPMIWSGGMAWIADFPDPSNFYGPILGCGGAVQGGWNWSWYCNEDLDAKAAEADSIIDPAKAEERNKMWSEIYAQDHGGRAVGAGLQRAALHHALAAHGRRPTRSMSIPVHIPVNYDYVYVNDVQ